MDHHQLDWNPHWGSPARWIAQSNIQYSFRPTLFEVTPCSDVILVFDKSHVWKDALLLQEPGRRYIIESSLSNWFKLEAHRGNIVPDGISINTAWELGEKASWGHSHYTVETRTLYALFLIKSYVLNDSSTNWWITLTVSKGSRSRFPDDGNIWGWHGSEALVNEYPTRKLSAELVQPMNCLPNINGLRNKIARSLFAPVSYSQIDRLATLCSHRGYRTQLQNLCKYWC